MNHDNTQEFHEANPPLDVAPFRLCISLGSAWVSVSKRNIEIFMTGAKSIDPLTQFLVVAMDNETGIARATQAKHQVFSRPRCLISCEDQKSLAIGAAVGLTKLNGQGPINLVVGKIHLAV